MSVDNVEEKTNWSISIKFVIEPIYLVDAQYEYFWCFLNQSFAKNLFLYFIKNHSIDFDKFGSYSP